MYKMFSLYNIYTCIYIKCSLTHIIKCSLTLIIYIQVPFVVHTSDGKNLPPDVQSNQQNIREQKPKIHHLSTLPTRDNFVHCNHNLLSPKTMVAMNPLLGNSKPPNFGKPMDYSHHFHRVCYTGFRPTCAYGVLACGGA